MAIERFITEEQLKLLTEDQAKFILEHAEKQLKDTIDTNVAIVSRTTTVLTLMIGLMIALVGYVINRWEANKTDELLQTGLVGSLYVLIIIFKLGEIFHPVTYLTVGAEPKDFFNDRLFTPTNSLVRLRQIYVNEILEYQKRITANKATIDNRWRVFKSCISWMQLIPIVLLVMYLITRLVNLYL